MNDDIRKDFPILDRLVHGKKLVYFDNAATSQKPRQVINAICDYYSKHNANIHRAVHTLSNEATTMVDESRRKVAAFIGSKNPEEIIFVRNATEGINLVMYTCLSMLQGGGAIVVSEMEHHSNLVTWQILALKLGMELRVIATDKEGRLIHKQEKKVVDGVVIGGLEDLLDNEVKLLAISYVSNVTGVINPVVDICRMTRTSAPKALILIDGSQAVPHIPVDVTTVGADFLVFSGHKALGPTGVGVLWGKKEILNKLPPFLYGGDMISEVKLSESTWNDLPWKFEAGTPDIAGIVALGAAVDYLKNIGMAKVMEHETELTKYALAKLAVYVDQGWLKLYGPNDTKDRLGVISFTIKGVHAHDAAQVLDNFGIAARSGQHCAAPLVNRFGEQALVRVSFYLYNTKAEVDYLVETLPKVADYFLK